jgi:hypothetical protein
MMHPEPGDAFFCIGVGRFAQSLDGIRGVSER